MVDFKGGYAGVILRVNLATREIVREKLDIDLAEKYIGGRGLNLKYLYDEIGPGIDPLGPKNKVIIGTGPCNGTLVPGSQRFTITAKSPLIGLVGDSNPGGDFGAELKYAGYDMVIIEGKSEVPVYLWINDDNVEIRDAKLIWGKTTGETRRMVEREVAEPEACVISIGPGSENIVKFGNIIAELGRASGRTGAGTVFASKNLKAVAVRSSHGVKVADYETLKRLTRQNNQAWLADKTLYRQYVQIGLPGGYTRYENVGMAPVRNFQSGVPVEGLHKKWLKHLGKQKACISCPLGCNHSFIIREGPYKGTYIEGVELINIMEPGPRIGNDTNEEVSIKACALCDDYGIDTFETTSAIAFAMECRENGILSASDAGGLNLEWGDAESILSLIKMIAYRRGIGEVLSQGLKTASGIIGKGAEKYAMQVKNMTFPGRNPRASKAWGLGFAVASRGACHMRGSSPEWSAPERWDKSLLELLAGYEDPKNPLLEEGKPENVKWFEELKAFQNSMEICVLVPRASGDPLPDTLAAYYTAVTGKHIIGRDALQAGERITNLERAFNIREGLTREDDTLPERMLKEPMPDGRGEGQVIDLEPMLDRYYELRGWDKRTGFPTREKLAELGLEDVTNELENMGKLAV